MTDRTPWARQDDTEDEPVGPLAEGTRDEKAARCAGCGVPCAVTSSHGMCVACELERRCVCPPVAPQYAPTGTRCWQCGGRM
jgi:hypothetical protein